ncbi:MAG: hypothetical protein AB1295_04265 [Candidatus Micrarchaeota archaeon]
MKIYAFLILLTTITFAYVDSCGPLRIDVWTQTMTKEGASLELSPYTDPIQQRQFDYFFIKNLTITNFGSCTVKNITLRISMNSPSRKEMLFCLAPFLEVKSLDPDGTKVFDEHDNPGGTGFLSCPQAYEELGNYYLVFEAQSTPIFRDREFTGGDATIFGGYSFYVNGVQTSSADRQLFAVKSREELEAVNEAKNSSLFSFISMVGTWAAVIIAIILAKITFKNQQGDSKELLNKLDGVANHIEDATDREIESHQKIKAERERTLKEGFLKDRT